MKEIKITIEIEGEDKGKEESSEFTTLEEIREKQSRVNIDFTKDNYLPRLNKEDLRELNKKDKPVLLKKSIIDRNREVHPDVKEEDYNKIIGETLYNPNAIFLGNGDKPYFNFIAKIQDEKHSVVLLEMADNKDNYEIVHLHWVKDKQLRTLERKGNKIKNS